MSTPESPISSGSTRLYRRASALLPESIKRRLRGARKGRSAVVRFWRGLLTNVFRRAAAFAPGPTRRVLGQVTRLSGVPAGLYLLLDELDVDAPIDLRLRRFERAIADEPWNDDVHRRRVDALDRSGRAVDADRARWEAMLLGAPSVAAHLAGAPRSERYGELVELLRRRPTSAEPVVHAVVAANDREQLIDTARALIEVGSPLVDSARLVHLVLGLLEFGEVRLPAELIESYADTVSSARLSAFRWRLAVDIDILDNGVRRPSLRLRRPRSISSAPSSLYLLHNSLPYQAGGYATRTHGLLTNLNAAGYRVTGVTRPGFPAINGTFDQRRGIPDRDIVDGVEYRRLLGTVTSLPRSDLAGFEQLYGSMLLPVIDDVRAPILHAASNWWNGRAAVDIAAATGLKSVYEVRGLWEVTRTSRQPFWIDTDMYALDEQYEASAARDADRVIVITGGLRDEMVRRGVDADKITVVPNAVDVERFGRSEPDRALRSQLDLDGSVVIGFVGSMTFYEGLDDLLVACAAIAGRSTTKFAVVFVGDGPIRSDLERQADELGISHLCRFVGRVPHEDVERYLSIIDITPFPRKPLPVCEMVSPLKPLESMACGIAVLASDVSALSEMVGHGDHGLLFAKGDVDDLAVQLERLVTDAELRHALSVKAEHWVRSERTWPIMAQRVGEIYEELVS